MKWNPVEYDNITLMRMPFYLIWTPGIFFSSIRANKINRISFKLNLKIPFFGTQPTQTVGVNGTRQVRTIISKHMGSQL